MILQSDDTVFGWGQGKPTFSNIIRRVQLTPVQGILALSIGFTICRGPSQPATPLLDFVLQTPLNICTLVQMIFVQTLTQTSRRMVEKGKGKLKTIQVTSNWELAK